MGMLRGISSGVSMFGNTNSLGIPASYSPVFFLEHCIALNSPRFLRDPLWSLVILSSHDLWWAARTKRSFVTITRYVLVCLLPTELTNLIIMRNGSFVEAQLSPTLEGNKLSHIQFQMIKYEDLQWVRRFYLHSDLKKNKNRHTSNFLAMSSHLVEFHHQRTSHSPCNLFQMSY